MHWAERASFAKIHKLLEIFDQERHHEVLLTVKNLHDLSRHPSPYTVLIIPRPLPSEVVEGKHFVVVDLLSLIPGGSSLAREAGSEATSRVGNQHAIRATLFYQRGFRPCPPGT